MRPTISSAVPNRQNVYGERECVAVADPLVTHLDRLGPILGVDEVGVDLGHPTRHAHADPRQAQELAPPVWAIVATTGFRSRASRSRWSVIMENADTATTRAAGSRPPSRARRARCPARARGQRSMRRTA